MEQNVLRSTGTFHKERHRTRLFKITPGTVSAFTVVCVMGPAIAAHSAIPVNYFLFKEF